MAISTGGQSRTRCEPNFAVILSHVYVRVYSDRFIVCRLPIKASIVHSGRNKIRLPPKIGLFFERTPEKKYPLLFISKREGGWQKSTIRCPSLAVHLDHTLDRQFQSIKGLYPIWTPKDKKIFVFTQGLREVLEYAKNSLQSVFFNYQMSAKSRPRSLTINF